MIKLFRKIRYDLMKQNKTSKYFKYAVGEIILVVIGILIALQINNWNENQKKTQIKQSYIENLRNDIIKDKEQLKIRLERNYAQLKRIDSIVAFMNKPSSDVAIIFNYIKVHNISAGLRVTNNYNDNTFNILISSGNIDLFTNDFTNDLMELNRLQESELIVSNGNGQYYFETLNNYRSKFYNSDSMNNQVLNEVLWEDKNPKDAVSLYINMKQQQGHTIRRYIELTELVVKKSESILEQLIAAREI